MLSNTTTVEQLGATAGQSIELQVQLPLATTQQPSLVDGGRKRRSVGKSSSGVEGGYRMPGAFIVQVKSGEQHVTCKHNTHVDYNLCLIMYSPMFDL